MKPVIIDRETGVELWTATQCAEFSGTARGTFTSYAGRGRAPQPVTKFNGLTLWNSDDIKEWQEKRLAKSSRSKGD
ncbi:helix-turn-helix transcriptional regulator [Corynebacterium urogenitale]